jgi:hypothetical protein
MELLSGKPGSNRPPRPWQGRALPNELLPLIGPVIQKTGRQKIIFTKNFTGAAKIAISPVPAKNLCGYLYWGVYKVLVGTFTSGLPL